MIGNSVRLYIVHNAILNETLAYTNPLSIVDTIFDMEHRIALSHKWMWFEEEEKICLLIDNWVIDNWVDRSFLVGSFVQRSHYYELWAGR